MDLSNSINRVIVSINSNKSISKSDDKNKWKLTDSIKEKITELAKKKTINRKISMSFLCRILLSDWK